MQVGTRHFLAEANKTAFLSYPEKRIQRALVSSAVCITLNRQKLNSVYSAMRGLDGVDALDPGTRLPALHVAGISFVSLFENMFRVINAADGNGQLLKQLAIDDSLYRLCVGLLDPAVIAGDLETHAANSYVRREVLQLCEFMQAHLTQPISLSKMEQMSGLSARVLQYSFQKSFGLRPKAWLRKQRLHAARAVLNDRSRKIKITSLAHDFCFHSPSEFAQHYLVEFGESPSETMRKNMR